MERPPQRPLPVPRPRGPGGQPPVPPGAGGPGLPVPRHGGGGGGPVGPMRVPVYRALAEEIPRQIGNFANAGLAYDRFTPWPTDGSKLRPEDRDEWLRRFVDPRLSQSEVDRHLKRRHELVKALGGASFSRKTVTRLVTGLGNGHPLETGLAWHVTLGLPYLPGSSIKGLLRAWVTPESEGGWGALGSMHEVHRLFGDLVTTGAGALIVFDALPAAPAKLEIDILNPHYSEYYTGGAEPADYLSPNPVKFLAVAAGSVFEFALAPRRPSATADQDLDSGMKLLTEALSTIGVGGKVAAGYGYFEE